MIPFIKGLPVVGNLISYSRDRLGFLEACVQKFGTRFRIKIGPKVLALIIEPEDVQHVMLTQMNNYIKATNLEKIFGNSVFTSNGEEWKAQRQILQPLMSTKYISLCHNLIKEKTKYHFEKYYDQHNEADSNIQNVFALLTFDIITSAVIGAQLQDEFKDLHTSLNSISDYLTKSNYKLFNLPKFLDKDEKNFERSLETINRIVSKAIKYNENNRNEKSMISLMMNVRDSGENKFLTNEIIRDNIVAMIFAGYETSALSLSWLTVILGQNNSLQDKAFEELNVQTFESLQMDDLNKMTYTDSLIQETLRLYPPGWAWTRKAIKDDDCGGYKIKKNEIVLVSPYLTHRLNKYWDKPNEFMPERFLNNNEISKFVYYPFGAGARICIGKQFAMHEMKVICHYLITNFKIHRKGKLPRATPLATINSKDGFFVQLKRRN
jgi:cytochrome P450